MRMHPIPSRLALTVAGFHVYEDTLYVYYSSYGPQKPASGRLLVSGNIMFPYTNIPNGVEGYHLSGIYGDVFRGRKLYDQVVHMQLPFNRKLAG